MKKATPVFGGGFAVERLALLLKPTIENLEIETSSHFDGRKLVGGVLRGCHAQRANPSSLCKEIGHALDASLGLGQDVGEELPAMVEALLGPKSMEG